MARVLKITKPDKFIHTAPIENKATLIAYNNRLPDELKWKIEEIDESEVAKLPLRDENHVTNGAEARTALSEKDAKIAALEAQLTELLNKSKTDTKDEDDDNGGQKATAKEVIGLIEAATTIEQVDGLIAGETRKGVLAAADKKKASFN